MTATVTKESLAARIAELESGARSLKEDYTLAAYKMLLATMDSEPVDPRWVKANERTPEPEIPVLIMLNGVFRIGEVRCEYPSREESYKPFFYWDDPYDDGQPWEVFDVTHWMPLPAEPVK